MDFSLTEEQQEFQRLAREFTQKEIVPKARHHDQTGEFPKEILKKAWELGLMNLHIPEEYGGLGRSCVDECLVAEEIAAGCCGMATPMLVNNLASAPVIFAGTQEQKKRFLTPLTEEFLFVAYAVTEPGAGSDVQALRTTAKRVGDDYVINGEKAWITGASVAHWFFVLALTDPAKKAKGMSTFLVPASTPGITVGKKEDNLGQRASDTRGVTFSDVVVSKEYLLGSEGDGFKIAMTGFDCSRPPVAAMAVGLARSAMEHSIRYAQERTTFGVPIHQHQGVGFMIADMAKSVEAARLLAWRAAWTRDQGQRNTFHASCAKAFAADAAMQIALDAVQVHGAYGYSKEYPVEKLLRDAKVIQIYEGTSQIQRLIIARELFQRK
ncbi:MAG: acyl-CoA dehydrogenase family protein [Candidatus Riflebacteria bacterium]|nr:acyl-CoA dehydrogenase family protein [Candidatus Riflebacteria bacterium]